MDCMKNNITETLEYPAVVYTENAAKYVLLEALKGLGFLHEKGIIHRDIKSDNVLYNFEGDIKLSDFGTTCQLTKEKNERNTMIGTPHWKAPEILEGEMTGNVK